jgi:hypothetical protein
MDLPLIDAQLPPSKCQEEVKKTYAVMINDGALPGNAKLSDGEATVKMHIKTVSFPVRMLGACYHHSGNMLHRSAECFRSIFATSSRYRALTGKII